MTVVLQNHLSSFVIFLFCVYRGNEQLLQVITRLNIHHIIDISIKNVSHTSLHNAIGNMSLSTFTDNQVQEKASFYTIWYRLLLNVPALISTTILGAWSDRHDRKYILYISLVGALMASSVFSLSIFPRIDSNWSAQISCILLGAFIYGCSGRSSAFSIGTTRIICDCASEDNRTRRLAHMQGFAFLGTCVGYTCLALCSKYLSYKWTLLVVASTLLLQIAFLAAFVRTPKSVSIDENTGLLSTDSQSQNESPDCKGFHCEILAIIRSYRNVFTSPENIKILVTLICSFSIQLNKVANQDILALFILREQIGWTGFEYGILMSIIYCLLGFILVTILPFIERKFKLSNKSFLLLGLFMNGVSLTGLGFAFNSTVVCIFGILDAFGCFAIPSSQAMLIKLSRENDWCCVLALNNLMGSIAQLASPILLTTIYTLTVNIFPGTVFVITGLLQFICFITVIFIL